MEFTAEELSLRPAMIFNYRFLDQSILAKEIVAERDFGQVVNVTGMVHYACWSHAIDLLHFFTGPAAEICALQSAEVRGSDAFEAETI